jgi:hypothetical protein
VPRPGYRKATPSELQRLGFSRTSERYFPPGARTRTVSRRQYDDARYLDAGWRSRDDYERRFQPGHANMAGYVRWREAAIATGAASPTQLDRPASEFNRLFLAARADGFDRGRKRRGPRSPIAKLLVYVGLRRPDDEFAVGGSP